MGDMNARARMGAAAWAQHPIGTGPYQWSSRTIGDNLTFTRYNGYWRGRPPLDKVVFKIIPDPTVATLALKNGDVDVLTNSIDTQALPSLRKKFRVLSAPSNTLYQAFLNFGTPRASTYKNVLAFHQGLAYLFNAQAIVPKIIGAFGVYTDQPLPTWQAGHDPNLKPYPYNPAKAKQLLTQAGYPPGSTLIFVVRNAPELCPVATAIQSQIQQVGYKVNLTCSDADEAGTGPNYNWDVVFTRTSGRVSASVFFNDRWRRSLAQAKDDYYTYQNAKMEAMLDQLQAQTDPKKSAAIARQVSDIIVRTGVADIPLYFPNTWVVADKKVVGLKLSPLGWQSMLFNSYTTVHLSS
jgi:peptide/nickel transport system substrate-binding protein